MMPLPRSLAFSPMPRSLAFPHPQADFLSCLICHICHISSVWHIRLVGFYMCVYTHIYTHIHTCMILSLVCFTWNIYIVPYNCIYNCIWFWFEIFFWDEIFHCCFLYIAIIVLCCLCWFLRFFVVKILW